MAAEAEALARRFYEAINRGDTDAALALLADDVRWHRPPDVPITGTLEGIGAVSKMWSAFTGSLERFEIEPTGYESEGDRVMARITMRGAAAGGGGDFEFSGAQVFRMAGDRIAEVHEFRSLPEARALLSS